jgi:PAS domain S-box-containing protein
MEEMLEQLTERVNLFELVNDASIDAIIVYSTNLRVVYWNKAAEQLTSIPRHEAQGHSIHELFPHFIENEEVGKGIGNVLKGRKVFLPYEAASPYNAYHEYHFVPLKNDFGITTQVLCIIHDVAHRIKAENELKALNKSLVRKNKELKSKNAELSSFSKVTSQDLHEPLHKMYTFIEMLIAKDAQNLPDSVRSYLKRIQGSVQRMRLFTDALLGYYEICMHNVVMANINPNHLLLVITRSISSDPQLMDSISVPKELPIIKGDKQSISILFRHLVSNAARFRSPDRQLALEISSTIILGSEIGHPDASEKGKYIRVSFADNGIGFDKKDAEQLFQVFCGTGNNGHSGIKVGLAICKKIVELHNGFITADSTPGIGSTFQVFLPYTGPARI